MTERRKRCEYVPQTSANLCPASLNFLFAAPPWGTATEDRLCTDLESADACDLVSGSITLNGCDCDGVRTLVDCEEAEPTNIPSTDDSADSLTLNRDEQSGISEGS